MEGWKDERNNERESDLRLNKYWLTQYLSTSLFHGCFIISPAADTKLSHIHTYLFLRGEKTFTPRRSWHCRHSIPAAAVFRNINRQTQLFWVGKRFILMSLGTDPTR